MRRASFSSAATGASAVDAVAVNPGGGALIAHGVAHPHVVDLGSVVRKQHATARGAVQRGASVLAPRAAVDVAAELEGDELGAVADAEDRHAEVVDRRVEQRRARRRRRSPGRRTGSAPTVDAPRPRRR